MLMRLSWIGLLAVVALGCGTPRGADPGVEAEAIKSLLERHRRAIEAEDITTVAQGFDRGGPLVVPVRRSRHFRQSYSAAR